jgi:hypothetical protein
MLSQAGFPSGMPGMGDEPDGAMQQALHFFGIP